MLGCSSLFSLSCVFSVPLPSGAHTLVAIAHCIVSALIFCLCLASHLRLCAFMASPCHTLSHLSSMTLSYYSWFSWSVPVLTLRIAHCNFNCSTIFPLACFFSVPLPSGAHTSVAIAHCIVLALLSCLRLASHLRLCAFMASPGYTLSHLSSMTL